MNPENDAAQSKIIAEIKRFTDVLHWGEIRPDTYDRMKGLTVPELELLLQELKTANSKEYVSRIIKAYLKRHEIEDDERESDSIHSD